MLLILADFNPHDPYFQWVLIAAAVGTLFYAVVRPAMRKKKDPLTKTPTMSSLAQQRNVERQMQNLLVELSEMTRQITAQLDTRSQKLQMLIDDADQRISTLKQLQQPITPSPNLAPVIPRSDLVPRNIPIPDPRPETTDDQHRPIYALSDQGRSATEIARQLDRPRGEVELILALRGSAE
jgi:hypothetical protein